ncbi:MAG: glycine cleavage system protein GcvH [Spirochaetales bacterium]
MEFKDDVKYQESHEWARKDGDLIVVGISDYAQDSLGDVVYVELPETGESKKKGQTFGVVESVKAASDVYMPIAGEIAEVNGDLDDDPSKVNDSPFESGWLIKVKPSDPAEFDALMSAEDYKKYTEGLDE